MEEYFKHKSLARHNITSFNKFLEKGMQRVIDEVKEVSPDILPPNTESFVIRFGRIWIEPPSVREADGTRRKVLPIESRIRDITYEAPIMLEMMFVKDGVEDEKKAIHIGEMPVMIKSKQCYLSRMNKEEVIESKEDPDDPGGYFILNGTERVIVTIEDLAPNRVFVEEQKTGPIPWIAKVFSEDNQYRIPHLLEKGKDGMIYLTFTRVNKIPFAVMLKALGYVRDKEITEIVGAGEKLMNDLYINLYESAEIKSKDAAMEYIGKKLGVMYSAERRIEKAENIIDKFLFPHIGHDPEDRIAKAHYLGRAVKKLLLLSHKVIPKDDKDHYANKRLRLCGDLMETLFRFSFRMLVGDMKYNFERLIKRGRLPSLQAITRSQLLTSRIKSALATGEWVGGRHGVSQHIDRLNFFATTGHLRRVVSLLTTSRENFEARDLHPTHWGKLCSSETPEGPNTGLRKNLAIFCEISTEPDMKDEKIIEELKKIGLSDLSHG